MKKFVYIIAFLTIIPLTGTMAQQGFSLGLGGGPNFYYGSFEEDNIGFTGQLDTRYNFNEKIALSFSYSFNRFQGAKSPYYFSESNANNLDLHLIFDILQLSQVVSPNSPLKICLDLGGGYSFFDANLHHFDSSSGSDEALTKYYIHPDEKPHAGKIHMGGEIAYAIDNSFTIYTSILGHVYFTSAADGHSRYPSGTNDDGTKMFTDAFNDIYISSALGLRYNLDNLSLGNSGNTKGTSNGSYNKNPHGSLFQNFRFNQYSGKKSPQKSYESNKSKQKGLFPGGRWQGKKKNSVPKSSDKLRFFGKKSNGNIPK